MARIGMLGIARTLTVVLLACVVGATAIAGNHQIGKKAFLGVHVEEETEWSEGGARVTRVVRDSAAEEAGIEDGDIVVSFDGATVRGPGGLTKAMQGTEPGDRAQVVVVRDGRERTFDVELGSHAAQKVTIALQDLDLSGLEGLGERLQIHLEDLDLDLEALEGLENLDLKVLEDLDLSGLEGLINLTHCEGDDCKTLRWHSSDKPLLGVQLVDATPELREHLGSNEDEGVLISKILPDTPAEDAGIRVGDLIVAIDGEAIEDIGDIRHALQRKYGEDSEIEVIRDGSPMSIDVAFPDKD